MENLKEFLKEFRFSESDFKKTDYSWKELQKIKNDYIKYQADIEPSAKYLVESLHKIQEVHSVRYRLKNPNKLIAKIIRKRIEDPERIITIDDYKEEITDLIGLRILHLFKEQWENINFIIRSNWALKEKPIAYYRKGDTEDFITSFKEQDCEPKEHPFGYRSVHYLLITQPKINKYIAELQVRTIFEEAWSEIDHSIRYPYDTSDPILNQFLSVFNRLSGSADEMGSFVLFLRKQIQSNKDSENNYLKKIEELKAKIKKLKLRPNQTEEIKTQLDDLSKFDFLSFNPVLSSLKSYPLYNFPGTLGILNNPPYYIDPKKFNIIRNDTEEEEKKE